MDIKFNQIIIYSNEVISYIYIWKQQFSQKLYIWKKKSPNNMKNLVLIVELKLKLSIYKYIIKLNTKSNYIWVLTMGFDNIFWY
jgi:hypothetical protein